MFKEIKDYIYTKRAEICIRYLFNNKFKTVIKHTF
jgi:hypothetical protein